jgi:DNA-binding XRE family transcriptional regulator
MGSTRKDRNGAECQLSCALKIAHFFETTVEKIWKRNDED